MKHILIPTDFSETSGNALEYALELARVSEADCTLLHAWEIPYDFASRIDSRIEAIRRNAKQKLEAILRQVREDSRFGQLILGCRLEEGKPEGVILEVAEETGADLIVMGLSDHNLLEGFISGNTGAEILDRSKIPVLAIPPGIFFSTPREMIYASEFREEDIHRLEHMSQWAKLFNARLRVIHIGEKNTHEEKMRFRGFIEEVEDRLTYPYITEELRLADGVEKGLLHAVEETDGAILAMAHHHRPFLKKMFSHSYTLSIASKVRVPLLVYGQEK